MHLVVFVHLVLSLLGLVFELPRQRGVLNHCQLGGTHKLILVYVKHFDFDGSDLQKHLFAKVVDLNHFVFFDLVDDSQMVGPLLVSFALPPELLFLVSVAVALVVSQLVEVILNFLYFAGEVFKYGDLFLVKIFFFLS